MAQLRDECKASGIPLVGFEVTFGEQLYPECRERRLYQEYPQARAYDFEKPCQMAVDLMARVGIPYLQLTPAFRQDYARTHHHLHWNGDGHWNIEGHALAASELFKFLRERGFVPRAGGLSKQ